MVSSCPVVGLKIWLATCTLGSDAGYFGGLTVNACGVVRGITLGADAGYSEGLAAGWLTVNVCGVVRGITLGADAGCSEGLAVAGFCVVWGIHLSKRARCSMALVAL